MVLRCYAPGVGHPAIECVPPVLASQHLVAVDLVSGALKGRVVAGVLLCRVAEQCVVLLGVMIGHDLAKADVVNAAVDAVTDAWHIVAGYAVGVAVAHMVILLVQGGFCWGEFKVLGNDLLAHGIEFWS